MRRQKPMFYKKKRSKFSCVVIALAAVLVIACGFLTYADVFAGLRRDKTAVSVYFPSDSSTGEIAEILHENDIIMFPAAFRAYRLFHRKAFVCGGHVISKSMTYSEIMTAVTSDKTDGVVAFVAADGTTLDEIALSAKTLLGIEKDDFYKALAALDGNRTAKSYEGYLLPGTYTVSDAAGLVREMTDAFNAYFDKNRCGELGITENQAVIIASLVQKEAKSPSEMKALAEDIHKKLKNNENLNSEAALKYMLGTDEITEEDKKIDSPYNTFMYAGLPKGAICCPGKAAIDAALLK